jgi:hypothetical protein
MQHALLEPLEIRKLVSEIMEDVIGKTRSRPGAGRHYDTSGKDWWRECEFQGEIEAEAAEKISDWIEFTLARS